MTIPDRKMLNELTSRIRERYADARVLAFGSRVRGDHAADSDLDVCIVLNRRVVRADKDWIGDVTWEVGYEEDRLISTIVFEREAIEEGPQSASPRVEHILRGGCDGVNDATKIRRLGWARHAMPSALREF